VLGNIGSQTRRRTDADLARDFKKLIADETEKWGKVVREANLKAE
jgi:hypothetical protein